MARFGTTQTSLNDAVGAAMDVANAANQVTVTAVATNNPTVLAAVMINNIIQVSAQTAAQTLTTDTATNLLALLPNAQVGQAFYFKIQNGHTSTGTVTVAGGTGVTVNNTYATAAQPITSTRKYRGIVTNVATPAITIYPIAQVS